LQCYWSADLSRLAFGFSLRFLDNELLTATSGC
jgi:hypothetical protein